MVYLRKEIFSIGTYHKLQARKIGPCRILQKMGDNAYLVDLPTQLGFFNTFDVVDLYPYHPPNVAREVILDSITNLG